MGPHPNVWAVIQGFIRKEADAGRQIMSNAADLGLGRKSLGEQTREQIKSVVGEYILSICRSWLTFSASNLICGCTHNQFAFL